MTVTREEVSTVLVDGRRLHVAVSGPSGAPGVVLVHGGDAHGGWWDPVVPALAERFRCVVPDLSGYGYSAHAQRYSFARWADEIVAAARAGGVTRPPVVVGHSLGGITALVAAHRHGQALAGVVAVDAAPRTWSPEELEPFHRRARRGHRVYATRDEITARFALRPEGRPVAEAQRLALAERAVEHVDGGWRWRFDPRTVEQAPIAPPDLRPARCPVALVVAEHGLTTPEMNDAVVRALDRPTVEVRPITGVGHHVPLEAPEDLVRILTPLVSRWTGRPT